MSDTIAQLKEIKGLLGAIIGVAVGCMVVGGLIMEWRISVNVASALAAQDLNTDSNIVAINSNIQANARTGVENAEDIEQNRERVEAAFAALLGRQVDGQ